MIHHSETFRECLLGSLCLLVHLRSQATAEEKTRKPLIRMLCLCVLEPRQPSGRPLPKPLGAHVLRLLVALAVGGSKWCLGVPNAKAIQSNLVLVLLPHGVTWTHVRSYLNKHGYGGKTPTASDLMTLCLA